MPRPLNSPPLLLLLGLMPGVVLLGGCGGGAKPLNPSTFLQPTPIQPSTFQPTSDTRIDQRRTAMDDRPGQLLEGARVDQSTAPGPAAPPTVPPKDRPIDQPLPTPDVTHISSAVSDSVKTPAESATQRGDVKGAGNNGNSESAEKPAAPLTSPSPGEYMTLGAVVVEVNGNPIYANKIIGDITPLLSARARESSEEQFQTLARDEVQKQTNVLIQSELEFAAAQRNLDSKDQKLANDLTMHWKSEQITQAGGSLEQARIRAQADGRDFDDLVNEQYRVEMRRIYFQKKEFPKLQITARDLRDYYSKHRDDLFTQHEQAKFRVIKIDFTKSGGRDAALAKITALRAQLSAQAATQPAASDDFAKVAGTTNDDASLLESHGDVGGGDWMQRGAYASEKIEDAVWQLTPGEMTPVIELPHQFAIAKLEEKQGGTVKGFEQPEVQAGIRRALEAEQFNELRRKVLHDLQDEAIIQPYPPHVQPAVEMAMQMYPVWNKKKH